MAVVVLDHRAPLRRGGHIISEALGSITTAIADGFEVEPTGRAFADEKLDRPPGVGVPE